MRRRIFSGVFVLAPVFSAVHLVRERYVFQRRNLFDRDVTSVELIAGCHLLICVISLWVVCEALIGLKKARVISHAPESSHHRRFSALLLGGLAIIGHSQSPEVHRVDVAEEAGLPVELMLTPSMAALLIRDILQRRRNQIRRGVMPDVLCDEETVLLSQVQRKAKEALPAMVVGELDQSLPVVKVLTDVVERKEKTRLCKSEKPLFIVCLYGYPEVKSRQGSRASFRKKRALELLVWLSLNRDRPRRSAARTALWHIDVSDATFSTVVSDMRRGLSELDSSLNRAEFLPTTYSDELLLSHRITTDYELLREALDAFRTDCLNHQTLADQLSEIRDVPFSGTSYEWADLDGTTTRLIITAMQASQELAEFARSKGDAELMMTAVAAGLRVMPGCEELLQIQEEFLAMKATSRSLV